MKKNMGRNVGIGLFILAGSLLLLLGVGCEIDSVYLDSIEKQIEEDLSGGEIIPVIFKSAVQTGGTSGITDSTALTLTFDVDPVTLTVDDISITGALKGILVGNGTTRSLSISNITVGDGETVLLAIASPTGYSISGSLKTAVVYRYNAPVIFVSAVQTGGTDGVTDSTGLTLTFDDDPTTLAANDITLTGATKGALSGSGTTRTLAISNITVANGEMVSVAITSPIGFTISESTQTAVVYRYNAPVTFVSAVQTGGTDGVTDSAGLTLTFDDDPTTLAANDITLTGATKGALSGSGTTRTLAISNITVANGEMVSVSIADPSGYTISGSPKTAVVYRAPYIGMPYQGGIIAYILQSGDPGYLSGETHGLIAATEDQGTDIVWISGSSLPQYASVPGGTGTALGTSSENTDNIIAQAEAAGNTTPTSYAAGLARAHDGGGNSDWYLPSRDELNKLYLNRVAVGDFGSGSYWSSSEYDSYAAWSQSFSTGSQGYGTVKYNEYKVRAVRAF